MIVLTTSTSPQIVYFVPREGSGNSDKIFLTDEQTNVTTTINITTYATGDYYHTATATFGLIEGHTYISKIGKTNDIRFYGRIFCTDNPSSNFTQTVTTNEFIIYE